MTDSLEPRAGHLIRGRAPGGVRARGRSVLAVDVVAFVAAVFLGQVVTGSWVWEPVIVAGVIWFLAANLSGTVGSAALRLRRQSVATFLAAIAFTAVGTGVVLFVLSFALFWLVLICALFTFGMLGRLLVYARLDRSPIGLALVVDHSTAARMVPALTPLLGPGYRISAVLEETSPSLLEDLVAVLSIRPVDLVVVSGNAVGSAAFEAVIHVAGVRGTSVIPFHELYEDLTGRCWNPEQQLVSPLPGSVWRTTGSRILDIVTSLGLVPLFLVGRLLALSGKILIREETFVGRFGEEISLGRFITNGGGAVVSRIFCSTALSWSPSWWHLLRGRLSVVGPGPLKSYDVGGGENWRTRQSVRPGLTGWARINGAVSAELAFPYDLYYVRYRSLGFDLGIVCRAAAGPLVSWRIITALAPISMETEEISRQELVVRRSDKLVSVIVPAYRERDHIVASLAMLVSELSQLGRPYEVIVVSDGNNDGTHEQAKSVPGPITVIHYANNRGKGYAIRRGLAESKGDRVVFIDADMELHPQGIGVLLSLLDAGADVAIGSKRHPESRVAYPLLRRVQSRGYQLLVRRLFGLDVTDTQTGIKAFRGDVIRRVAPLLQNDGFAFDLELLVELTHHGAVIAEGPVNLNYRFSSTTSLTTAADVLGETLRLWNRRRQLQPIVTELPVPDQVP